jgi:hypothetical protein
VLPASPPLPAPDVGPLEDTHDAAITPETIIPPWYGERLDLDHAIYVCFANARTQHAQRERAGQPDTRHRVTVYESQDWPERIRQYYASTDGQPRRPVPIPIPV